MLFLLTGDVQIGKTRWLESLCASLQAAGTCVAGVVAPGQWVPRPEGQPGGKHGFDGAGRFEKLASTTCCCRRANASSSHAAAT